MKSDPDIQKKLALGLALIALGVILVFGKSEEQILSTSFENEPLSYARTQEHDPEGPIPSRILIPSVGVDIDVNEAKIVNGYWEVFENSAGWGEGSGYVGKKGNQVIFAHAREGLFLPLRNVELDSNIYVLTKKDEQDVIFEYKIKEIQEVSPNQIEVIEPTEDETLTLYTCSGYSDSKRLIVVAKRV